MGQVYRARDELRRRRVAIKVIRGAGPDHARAAKRILREARMAAALHHPNIVSLFDFGQEGGMPYIVMERVEGESLRAHVDSNASGEERLRWLIDVARALAAAHRTGLVHRDIKPENVMLGRETLATRDDRVSGTIGYMAPETLLAGVSDARSDQFAWGAARRSTSTSAARATRSSPPTAGARRSGARTA